MDAAATTDADAKFPVYYGSTSATTTTAAATACRTNVETLWQTFQQVNIF